MKKTLHLCPCFFSPCFPCFSASGPDPSFFDPRLPLFGGWSWAGRVPGSVFRAGGMPGLPEVIDRIHDPDACPDFAFSGEDDLLEIWFPPIRDQDCADFLLSGSGLDAGLRG